MTSNTEPLIEVDDVCYAAADGTLLLDHVRWTIRPGESWAVLGPNGAGKTLLLRTVAGKLWPNAGGEIRRQGKKLVNLRLLARRIGWVSSKMVADIPGDELVINTVVSGRFAQLGLKPVAWDRPSKADFQAAAEILDRLNCEDLSRKEFGYLSQGEQQKVLLARALSIDPLAIILDEPCSSLDPGSREQFLDTLQTLMQSPSAPVVILVTHHVEEIVPVFQRVLVMHRGKVIKQGATSETLTPETLAVIYGRQPQEVLQQRGRHYPIW